MYFSYANEILIVCKDNYGSDCIVKDDLKISLRDFTLKCDFKNKSSVTRFMAENRNIQFFPKGIGEIFPNLSEINIKNCELKELHSGDLDDLKNLKEINLSGNKIKNITEVNLFKYNPEITNIDLSSNRIRVANFSVFEHSYKLSSINISNNICIENTTGHEKITALKQLLEEKCSNKSFAIDKFAIFAKPRTGGMNVFKTDQNLILSAGLLSFFIICAAITIISIVMSRDRKLTERNERIIPLPSRASSSAGISNINFIENEAI